MKKKGLESYKVRGSQRPSADLMSKEEEVRLFIIPSGECCRVYLH